MQAVQKPSLNIEQVYKECYTNSQEHSNCLGLESKIFEEYNKYDARALKQNLYTIKDCLNANESRSMKWLYENKMSKGNTSTRKYYDYLMSLPKQSICPFCGFNIVSTLDHYLPKSNFPAFSVLPYNLIACCSDCNKMKSSNYAALEKEQTLHPYYDHKFFNKRWLFASVVQDPLNIKFYVDPPNSWSKIDKNRVEVHFKNYELANKFSIKARSELLELYFKLEKVSNIEKFLLNEFNILQKLYKNHWKLAMYGALYKNQWYCAVGYKKI